MIMDSLQSAWKVDTLYAVVVMVVCAPGNAYGCHSSNSSYRSRNSGRTCSVWSGRLYDRPLKGNQHGSEFGMPLRTGRETAACR